MKVIKYLLLILLIYFLFIFSIFLFIDSPVNESSPPLPANKENAAKITLSNLWPDFTYRLEIYLNKGSRGDFIIEDENRILIYQNKDQSSETIPIRIKEISKSSKITLYVYEIPHKPSKEEIEYNEQLRILRSQFLEKIINEINQNNQIEFSKDIQILMNQGPYPGQEQLKPLLLSPKSTVLKKVVARPVKNLKTLLLVNKIILNSYKNYLLKDKVFKIFYIFLITIILWSILKIKRELR